MWTEISYSWSWRRRHDRLVEGFTSWIYGVEERSGGNEKNGVAVVV